MRLKTNKTPMIAPNVLLAGTLLEFMADNVALESSALPIISRLQVRSPDAPLSGLVSNSAERAPP